MFGWVDSIIKWFETIWNFISNLISSFITLFSMISAAVALPPVLVGLVPAVIGSTILAVVSLAVVKLIVGR